MKYEISHCGCDYYHTNLQEMVKSTKRGYRKEGRRGMIMKRTVTMRRLGGMTRTTTTCVMTMKMKKTKKNMKIKNTTKQT